MQTFSIGWKNGINHEYIYIYIQKIWAMRIKYISFKCYWIRIFYVELPQICIVTTWIDFLRVSCACSDSENLHPNYKQFILTSGHCPGWPYWRAATGLHKMYPNWMLSKRRGKLLISITMKSTSKLFYYFPSNLRHLLIFWHKLNVCRIYSPRARRGNERTCEWSGVKYG